MSYWIISNGNFNCRYRGNIIVAYQGGYRFPNPCCPVFSNLGMYNFVVLKFHINYHPHKQSVDDVFYSLCAPISRIPQFFSNFFLTPLNMGVYFNIQ